MPVTLWALDLSVWAFPYSHAGIAKARGVRHSMPLHSLRVGLANPCSLLSKDTLAVQEALCARVRAVGPVGFDRCLWNVLQRW